MMWNFDDHMSGWGWTFMGVGMVLFWAVVIAAVVVLVRTSGRRREDDRALTPADILARRFARGEITEDEFVSRSKLVKH